MRSYLTSGSLPMDSPTRTTLKQNLTLLLSDVHAACRRALRNPMDVRIVAVTKYAAWEHVAELAALHSIFGENRPQQLAERQVQLPEVEWHLIGQLQRNKVRLALQHASMIHSVDSVKLVERIAEMAAPMKIRPEILLQVNVSGEASKSGFSPEDLTNCWQDILAFTEYLQIRGLMTMAPETNDPESARSVFRMLRQFRDQLVSRSDSRRFELQLPELSMGMSGDFVPAVEEGATLIRIGSRIFSGLPEHSTT